MSDIKTEAASLKELSKQSAYGFIGNGFLQFFTFIASIVYTNFLGAELFGVYSGLISFFTLLSTFVLFAFDRSLILYLTQQWFNKEMGKVKGTMITSLLIMLGLFILSVLIFLIFRQTFLDHYLQGSINNRYLFYGFLFLFFTTLITFFDTAVNSMKNIAMITISKVVRKLATLGFFLVGYYTFDKGLDSLFVAQVIGLIFGIAYYMMRKYSTFKDIRSQKSDYSSNPEMLKYSLTLFLVGLSTAIVRDIDKIMLSTFMENSSEVAFYVVALRTGMLVSIFGSSIAMIYRPRVAEVFAMKDNKKLESDYQVTTRWIVFLSVPALVTFFVLPSEILSVYGPEFRESGMVLRLVIIGVFAEVAFGLNTVIMVLSGKKRLIVTVSLTGVFMNVLLNYLLIPHYGANGAAFATIITFATGRLMTLIFVYREFGILPFKFKALMQVIVIIALLILFTYILKFLLGAVMHPVILVILAGAISYLLTTFIYLRFAVSPEEREMLINYLPEGIRKRLGL